MEGELLFGGLVGVGVFAFLVLPASLEILFIAAGEFQDIRVPPTHDSDIRQDVCIQIRWRSLARKISIYGVKGGEHMR